MQLGCAEGNEATNFGPAEGVAILAFGQPWYNASTGEWGVNIFDANASFIPLSKVEYLTKQYLQGFWNCTPPFGPTIDVVAGTSNYQGYTGYDHGYNFATMVSNVSQWLLDSGYTSQLFVVGGIDAEPDWNSPAATRAWADGYTSKYLSSSRRAPYYNFGSCDGCSWGNFYLNNGWTIDDVWYMSYGAPPAWPIPEMYVSGVNNWQWQWVSKWAKQNKGNRIHFLGSLTQWQAAGNCCTNTPGQGWSELYDALNSDADTAQDLRWSTDISWAN